MKMNFLLPLLVTLLVISSGLAANLTCYQCIGNGTSCRSQGKIVECQGSSDIGHCGRVTFKVNGKSKVVEQCTKKEYCRGTIDCLQDGFELGKGFPGASDCVVSCCLGDNCNPKTPLKCHQCKGEGETCSNKSVSCRFGQDRCVRINFKVNGILMVDEHCHRSSLCFNKTTTCGSVQKDYPTATECDASCCQGDHCNDDVVPNNANRLTIGLLFALIIWGLIQ